MIVQGAISAAVLVLVAIVVIVLIVPRTETPRPAEHAERRHQDRRPS